MLGLVPIFTSKLWFRDNIAFSKYANHIAASSSGIDTSTTVTRRRFIMDIMSRIFSMILINIIVTILLVMSRNIYFYLIVDGQLFFYFNEVIDGIGFIIVNCTLPTW